MIEARQARRIMIVENEWLVAQDIKMHLEEMEYEVTSIETNGPDALVRAGQDLPDIVLMDIVLNGEMTGIQTAGFIQKKFKIPHIYITSYSSREVLEGAKVTQPYGYLTKPFYSRDLRAVIETASYRYEMEHRLREREEIFTQLTENIHQAFIIGSADWSKIYYVSPPYEKIWGRPASSLMESPVLWLDSVVTEDREMVELFFGAPAHIQEQREVIEYRIERPDGSVRWIYMKMVSINDYNGDIYRYAAVAEDITIRKETEQELLRHGTHLEELLQERTRDLKEAHEQLLQEMAERKLAESETIRVGQLAAVGELAAGIAHEINNPINGIINYAQILANKTKEDSEAGDITGRILKESDRISRIVSSLLSFSREGRDEKQPVSVGRVVAEALTLSESQVKMDGIMIELDVSSSLPMIMAQPQQVEQIFLNLVSNARYALNEKYPGLHEDKVIEIRAEKILDNSRPFLSVVFLDRGTGISADVVNKIMNPFFSTKPDNVGTGLGLSISHGIMKSHGGRILVDSVEGDYTKITLLFPLPLDDVSV